MFGDRQIGILQCAIQRSTQLADRHGAVNLFSVDEQCRSGFHAEPVGLFHRSLHRTFVLRLNAGLQLDNVKIVLLALQHGEPVEFFETGWRRFFVAHIVLVGVNIIRKIPVSIAVLRRQAVGVHRGVDCPRMNFR